MMPPITSRWVVLAAIPLTALFALGTHAQTGPGFALDYSGSGQYVSVSTGKIPSSGDFTVECWARLDSGGGANAEIISQGTSGNAFYMGYNALNGTFTLGDGWATTSVPYPVAPVAWHHLAVVKTASSASFYLDGVLKTNRTSPIPNPALTEMRFARHYGANLGYWPGVIDEVRIWNTARTQSQITNTMGRPLVGNEANLVSYWRFDEGTGSSTFPASGGAGDFVNTPSWVLSTVPFVPGVLTSNAINITATSATLKGTVYFNSSLTAAWFDWGTTTNYGNQTAFTFVGTGTGSNQFSVNVSNLAPFQVYHFRLAGSNTAGLAFGTNRTFVTLSTNANLTALTSTAGPPSTPTPPTTLPQSPIL